MPCLAKIFMKGNRIEKDFFAHESSYIDDDVIIGAGTKIWHFCHIQITASDTFYNFWDKKLAIAMVSDDGVVFGV
ncbi:MAG: hypothetical protein PHW03_10020 [Eubacteriales bacterium]|nr:hypothetical protein [Eubacteriales bacterium]